MKRLSRALPITQVAEAAPRALLERLEPRILYSADAAAVAHAVGIDAPAHELRLQQDEQASHVTARIEIAFVDLSVPDAQGLIADLQAQRSAGRPIEIVTIDAAQDGVALIGATLAGRQDITAVHVLAHGSDGVLQLGNARLDVETLIQRAGEVAGWGIALTADADLLLYGCDVAQTAAGQQFVADLAALTGADVAASTDTTGAAARGGNWALEFGSGRIDAAAAIGVAGQQAWTGTLAVAFTSQSSGGATSATTSYSFSHNVNSGSDRLLLVELVIADGVDASSVSFNGNALTFLARQDSPSGHVGVELWYLVAPPVISGTVDVTLASASTLAVGATSYSGASQTTPFGTPVLRSGILALPGALVAADTGDLVVDIVGASSVTSNFIGAFQTQNFVQNQGPGATDLFAVSSREAGAALVSMSHVFTSTDGNWASIAVEINQGAAINAAPVVTTTGTTLAYTENQAATAVDSGLTVTDADSANLTGAAVSISANYANGQDVLAFSDQLGISGSWNATSGVLTLSGTATAADYQSALRSITYANGSDDPSTLVRTISFVVNDGAASSTAATRAVTVAAVADHVITVSTTSDTVDGTTSSIDALLANKGSDGLVSLREAIIAANNTANAGAGPDSILFAIGGGGVQTITLTSALPTITDALVIDGTSQGGFAGVPLIELNGNNLNSDGLSITGGGSTVRGLVINGFQKFGISLGSVGNNVIQGNYIGTNTAGTAALANRDGGIKITTANNLIGGTSAADRNVISGNGSGDVPGISISGAAAQGNLIQGNYIGLNAAGTSGVPNSGSGIDIYGGAGTTTIGGTVAGAGNVISGNDTGSDGIWIKGGSGNVIQGNLIGTDAAGVAAVPNDYSGIYIDDSSDNSIGGTTPGAGNVIAYSTNGGVIIIGNSSQRNAILGNSIYGNTSLGIDLREDGVSLNNGTKSGSTNAGMDSPVFTAAALDGSTLTLTGYVGSAAGQATFAGARVEVFVSDVDVSGYGEGRTYLGALTADASGNFSGSLTVGGVGVGNSLTATATDALGNTSEFGINRVVASGVNAPPTATNLSAPEAYTEDTPLNLTNIVVSDVDSANITATLTLSNVAAGSLSMSTSGAVTSSYDTGTGVWTASGAITDVNALLAGLTFTPSANFNGDFTVATSISDGSLGVAGSKAVTGTAVNDAPLASGGASLAAVNEDTLSPNGGTVASLFGANFSDPADAGNVAQNQFAGIVVRGQLVDAAEGRWEYSTDGGTNWSGFGFISDTNSIALGLSDRLRFLPAANYQGTPNNLSVRLVDNSVAIASGATVDASSNGGSSAFSAAVVVTSTSVASVNDAPSGADRTVTVLEEGAHTFSAADFGFSDVDNPANMLLAVRVATLPGAGALTNNGVAVAAGQLVSAADIDAGRLIFTPVGNGNGVGYASFTFQVQDDGGIANGGANLDPTPNTVSLDVTAVNDPPALVQPIADQAASEDAAFSFVVPAGSFTDADAGDTLTYAATLSSGATLPAWLSFDAATRTFSGTPANGDVGAITLRVTATDSASAAAYGDFTLTVGNVNDPPVLVQPIADQAASEDAAFSFVVPAGSFTDADAGDTLTYAATLSSGAALPSWLSFDVATRTFSGTPGNADVGALTLRVTVTDGSGTAASDDVVLTVANANDAPTLGTPVADRSATEDAAFSYALPAFAFGDVDAGDTLNVSATLVSGAALPAWLNFDAATRSFSGTPANADVGAITIRVTATDSSLASVSDDFVLTVNNTNDTPRFTSHGGAAAAAVTMAENTTAADILQALDDDANTTLGYTISGGADAAALRIDAQTGALTFVTAPDFEQPADANGDGRYEVEITASDGAATVRQSLSIDVLNVNEAPTVQSHTLVVYDGSATLVLRATDVDTAPASLVYRVLSSSGGRFESSNGGPGLQSFTQADVDAGRVAFVQDGSGLALSYQLELRDGDTVVAVTAPTVVRQQSATAPTTPTLSTPVSSTAAPSAAAPAEATAPEVTSAVADAVARPPAPPPLDQSFAATAAFESSQAAAAAAAAAPAQGSARNAGDAAHERDWTALNVNLLSDDAALAVSPAQTLNLDPTASASARAFADQLDRMRQQSGGDEGSFSVGAASATALATGLSAGYVLWLLRGGVLLASLISSVPVWAAVDPLPVLGRMRRSEDDDDDDAFSGDKDDDQIERLFSRARRIAARPVEVTPPPVAPAAAPTAAHEGHVATETTT